jgi:hypothetical protein
MLLLWLVGLIDYGVTTDDEANANCDGLRALEAF